MSDVQRYILTIGNDLFRMLPHKVVHDGAPFGTSIEIHDTWFIMADGGATAFAVPVLYMEGEG